MKAYSYDLRLRVLRVVNQGRPQAEIVAMFAISLACIGYLAHPFEKMDRLPLQMRSF
jgi:hypothetical protein